MTGDAVGDTQRLWFIISEARCEASRVRGKRRAGWDASFPTNETNGGCLSTHVSRLRFLLDHEINEGKIKPSNLLAQRLGKKMVIKVKRPSGGCEVHQEPGLRVSQPGNQDVYDWKIK